MRASETGSSLQSLGCAVVVAPTPLHLPVLAGTQFSESLALVLLALAQWLSFLKSSVVLPLLLPLCLKIASRALCPAERMTLVLNYLHGMQVKKHSNKCLNRSSHNNLFRALFFFGLTNLFENNHWWSARTVSWPVAWPDAFIELLSHQAFRAFSLA